MAMIFTLVTTLKERAEEIAQAAGAEVQAERDRVVAMAEEEENWKFQGEGVTRDSFWRWREGWRREMEGREGKREREGKLTGRELWERGLVGGGEEGEEDDGG